jgi:PAS domain S-box-containing protein
LLAGCPTPLALLRLEEQATIAACNAAWKRILGGDGPLPLRLAEVSRALFETRVNEARTAEAPQKLSVRLADAPAWVELTLWRADEGALWVSAAPAIVDEAEQARALLAIFDAMDAALWTTDRDGRVTLSEGSALARVGLSPGEHVGRLFKDIYPGNPSIAERNARASAGEQIRHENVSDNTHWMTFHAPARDERGELSGAHGLGLSIGDDLTLAKRGRALTDALERLPISIWAVDMAGVCVMIEGGLLALIGATREMLLGKDLFAMYRARGQEDLVDALSRSLKGEVLTLEHANATMGRVLRSRYAPVHDGGGRIVGACAVTEDITVQRDLERELRAQLELVATQQRAIAELGTPIIEVWQDILAVPVVSTLDPARAERLLDALLEAVSARQARFALLDLTGVETVDTHTAQHLVRVIEAVGLLGCEGLITGIRPSVAETLVALGVDLSKVRTLRSLKDALRFCARESSAPGSKVKPYRDERG